MLLALINDAKVPKAPDKPDKRSCKICNLIETWEVEGKDYENEHGMMNLVNVL